MIIMRPSTLPRCKHFTTFLAGKRRIGSCITSHRTFLILSMARKTSTVHGCQFICVSQASHLDCSKLMCNLVGFGQFFYDSGKINESEVPDNFLDLLEPKWKGKLILTYPNDDDAITYLFSILVSRYGFDWFDRLAQQDIQWVRGTGTPFILLSQGVNNSSSTRTISFTTTHLDGFSPLIKSKVPTQEEYMSWFQTMAIFKSTNCPESAKLFVSWILSDEWQSTTSNATTTPLNYLNALSGNQVYTNNNTQTQGFRNFMIDRTVVEWWRFQFELTLGPAVGANPNDLF